MSSVPLVSGAEFGSTRYAKKVWEEYGLRPYKERPRKAKSAKGGGKGKGGKGKSGKGGKGGKSPHPRKRAHSARRAEEAHDYPQYYSEDDWEEEDGHEEEPEDHYWSDREESPKRAKRVHETEAPDELWY